MSEHVVVAEGVKKTYEDGGMPVQAVRGVDLTIDVGEFSAVVGPSGS
jgi:putative ABC transport system ATP-binding protein